MHIAVVSKASDLPVCRGGFVEVFRAEHGGRLVAVKCIRVYANSNLELVASVNPPLFGVQGDFGLYCKVYSDSVGKLLFGDSYGTQTSHHYSE